MSERGRPCPEDQRVGTRGGKRAKRPNAGIQSMFRQKQPRAVSCATLGSLADLSGLILLTHWTETTAAQGLGLVLSSLPLEPRPGTVLALGLAVHAGKHVAS